MRLRNVIAGLVVAAGATIAASNLIAAEKVMTMDLPYTVTVNDTVLAPGSYVIRDFGTARPVLVIFGDKDKTAEVAFLPLPCTENKAAEKAEISLRKIGDRYFLTKITLAGTGKVYEVPLPASEREREKEAAGH